MFVWKKPLTNFLPVQSILTNDEINEKPSPYLQKHLLLMTNSFSSLPEVSLSQCSSAITSSRFVLPLSWTIAEEVTAASSFPFVCELYFIAASQIKTPRKTFKGFVCDQVQMSRCDFQALGNLRPVSFSESHPWNSLKTLCSSHTWYCTNSPTCHVCSWFCDFFFKHFPPHWLWSLSPLPGRNPLILQGLARWNGICTRFLLTWLTQAIGYLIKRFLLRKKINKLSQRTKLFSFTMYQE